MSDEKLVSNVDVKEVPQDWIGAEAEIQPIGVHELFERQAARLEQRQATALVHGDRNLSYLELDRLGDRVADCLVTAGVRAGDPVGMCLDRSIEFFAGIIGVLKAGAFYVPLDTSDPDDRIRHIADDAAIGTFITDGRREPRHQLARYLVLTEDWDFPDRAAPARRRQVDPASAAYAIFTSGSTGKPKGVKMTHRSLVNLLCWHDRTRPGSCQARTAQVCTVSFDFSFHEIFSTLCFGGTLVVAGEEERQDPRALASFVADQAIERIFLPVNSLKQFAVAAEELGDPLALSEVITTGERLSMTPSLTSLLRRTKAQLHSHYGATEFQDASVFTVSGDTQLSSATVPIGRPIDNMRVYVLDEQLRPVSAGAEGELYVAGAGVAAGYLNNCGLSAERFLEDPLRGGRCYRTGDLARVRADGAIEHLGRTDEQLKIRGFRVEPGEVETVLLTHPLVTEAAVAAKNNRHGHSYLVAYLVLRKGREKVDLTSLRARMSRVLPAYMIPSAVVVLSAMPRTPSGKLDRRSLPAPETFTATNSDDQKPRSRQEEVLCALFAQVLGLASVSVNDNFFYFGGDSLSANLLINSVRGVMKVELNIRDLFDNPTVAELAPTLRPSVRERPTLR